MPSGSAFSRLIAILGSIYAESPLGTAVVAPRMTSARARAICRRVAKPFPTHEKRQRPVRYRTGRGAAEEVGFEPTRSYQPLPVFETGALGRYATPPGQV